MVWQALLTCNLVALLAMLGATGLMIDTIRPDQPPYSNRHPQKTPPVTTMGKEDKEDQWHSQT